MTNLIVFLYLQGTHGHLQAFITLSQETLSKHVSLRSMWQKHQTSFLIQSPGKRDSCSADLLDEGHRESIPGDNAMVHQFHEGRQSEGQQVAKTTRQHTQNIGNLSVAGGRDHRQLQSPDGWEHKEVSRQTESTQRSIRSTPQQGLLKKTDTRKKWQRVAMRRRQTGL